MTIQNEFKLIWQGVRANCIIKMYLFCYILTLKFTRNVCFDAGWTYNMFKYYIYFF